MPIDDVQEKLFNVRAAVPDHMETFKAWRAASDAYRTERADGRFDLAYGAKPTERLDFLPPAKARKDAPLVMLIHGGYWQALDKADTLFAARALNEAGVAVAVVNYTLCPATDLAGIVEEMRGAAAWLWRNAAEFGVAPNRMFVAGHSAGGHLAAMMMATDWPGREAGLPGDLFKGAVCVSGLYDLTALVDTTINIKVGMTAETARGLSPVNQVPASGAPLVLTVGEAESAGFHDQIDRLAAAWPGVPIDTVIVPGANHFGAFEALNDRRSRSFWALGAMIGATATKS